ncbi:hypothetical protein ACWD00_25310 [Streptomyces viridiviolaceus]
MTDVAKGQDMNACRRKRYVVLSAALILGLSPIGVQQASAAPPSETHANVSAAISSPSDYRQGYRVGFRDGFGDARNECHFGYDGVSLGRGGGFGDYAREYLRDYARGYADGYSFGYARAERQYCFLPYWY